MLDLLIKNIIKNTTRAIPITPVQIPALKIPPIAAQLLNPVTRKIIIIATKGNENLRICFILSDCEIIYLFIFIFSFDPNPLEGDTI